MGQDLTKLTPDELKARQIKEMDAEMKQKLQRGANYNMKVVIKGDKNTGKTCLWRRLQRMSFLEDYRSTEQIQIATIAWDYKATSDKIKVEVWDVVDKASKRKESGNLKIGIQGEDGLDVDLSDDDDEEHKTPNLPATTPGVNPQGSFAVDKLDAETVNVYKNCHAVLFLMDPRKKWTFDYIERELPNVPKSVFVLILVNYKDVPQNQRVISEYELQEFARNAGKFVRCLECSMRNCYGMKGIRCFFNLPFLKLKRQYIIQQLKENEADLDAADQELDLVNSEQNYDFYLKWLEENRKNVKATAQMTSVLPDGPPPRAAIGSSKGTEVTAASLADDPKMQNRSRSASVPQNPAAGGPARQPTTPAKQPPAPVANTAVRGGVGPGGFGSYSHALPKSTTSQPPTAQTPAASARTAQPPQPTTPQRAPAAAAPPAQAEAAKTAPAEGGGLMSWTSKLFSSSAASSPAKPAAAAPKREVRDVVADLQKLAKDPAARSAQTPTSVEDFVPPTEGGGDDFWGGDDDDDDDDEQKANANGDSDDDDGRSLIAKDEDLDDDDDDDDDEEEVSPAAAKAKAKREREEREKREREREQKERELKEKERQRKEREERERRERERAQAEALRRQFEQQEAAAAAKPAAGDYEQVSDDDDDDDDVTADVKSAAPNGHKPAEKPKKKEKSIWGTKEEDSDDDDDDDDDNEAWGLPPKNKKDGAAAAAAAAAKKKTKSNPFIVTNDEDLPSDDDGEKPAKPMSVTSASMGVLPSATTSVSEKERRREEKERERESRRKRRGVDGSYGDLADVASKGNAESSSTPEGERKERKSRHRHRGERGDEATPEGERRERKSRHRHRGEGGETTTGSGSGERESRRSSRSSKRSHHRSRSASPTPPS